MAKKETLCVTCKFFNETCKHKSNLIIQINKKVEKEIYKNIEQKTKCEFYEK